MKLSPQPEAIRQFRLWEDSDFDPVVIKRLRRRAEDRDAERTRRRLLSPIPPGVRKARLRELRAWEAEQTARIQDAERERQRLEAILVDPDAGEKAKRLARIELAGVMYREQSAKGDL